LINKASQIGRYRAPLIAGFALLALMPSAMAQVGREQDIVNLRLGQRVLVDDGTCPAGQVKEVSGSQMTAAGVVATRKCIPRRGAPALGVARKTF
jgi:hypothetical protein